MYKKVREVGTMKKKVNYQMLINHFWMEVEARSKDGRKVGGGKFMVVRRLFGSFLIGMN